MDFYSFINRFELECKRDLYSTTKDKQEIEKIEDNGIKFTDVKNAHKKENTKETTFSDFLESYISEYRHIETFTSFIEIKMSLSSFLSPNVV